MNAGNVNNTYFSSTEHERKIKPTAVNNVKVKIRSKGSQIQLSAKNKEFALEFNDKAPRSWIKRIKIGYEITLFKYVCKFSRDKNYAVIATTNMSKGRIVKAKCRPSETESGEFIMGNKVAEQIN